MTEVMRSIRAAQRPLLLLGGGCVGCDEALMNELVEVLGVPVVYTFMGKVRGAMNMKTGVRCHVHGCMVPCMGGGCVGCDEALMNVLVEVLGVPVVYTFMGKVRNRCHEHDHKRHARHCDTVLTRSWARFKDTSCSCS
jgi:thiamine pyrophosphate-dependent acetolactate synthase large subunit-like protein